MKKIALTLILALALFTRWYKIDAPVADWHSFRQADTASVSHQYLKNGIDLLRPSYHDLSNIPSGEYNPQGYRMVEFPLYNAIHASLAKAGDFWTLDQWGRALSVAFSLGTIIFLYLIIEKISNSKTALLSAFILAIMPFNIFYSRTILPEPLMLFLLMAGSYFFVRMIEETKAINFLISSLLLAASLLVKPYTLFFFLPLFALALKKWGIKLFKKPLFYLYPLLVFIPLVLWRLWIQNFPAGIPVNAWLLNMDNIRLRPAWWRWLFAERLSKLILGYWGLPLFVFGLLQKPLKTEKWFYHFWLLGIFAYLVIFAGGNVTHDYYQFIITPVVAVFVAKGLIYLFSPQNNLIRPLTILISIFSLGMMVFLSWYQVREYYKINNPPIVSVGQKADRILPDDAKVIAPYNGDTAFLYQIKRQGWPAVTTDLTKLIDQGATHYVSINFDQTTSNILNNPAHQVIEKTEDYVIVKLDRT